MHYFVKSITALSLSGKAAGAGALILFFGWFPQNAFADHINFRERDMRTIAVGQTRVSPIFYGCQNKRAAIELSTWIDAAAWTMDKIMGNENARTKFGGDYNCDEHRLKSVKVLELLYRADQERGEDKVGRDGKIYFGTRYSSILWVTSNIGDDYYMLANQLIEGKPTEQDVICQQVLQPVCP
jgi:hypothetical protein